MNLDWLLRRRYLRPLRDDLSLAEIGLGIWLIGCTFAFCVGTLNWPLVNDAALIHYISFLMSHGLKPYNDIPDPNMPGTYLIDWAVIRFLGADAIGSRLYDLLLLGLMASAMLVIAWRRSRFAAVYAACVFALFHGRDGMMQLAQRDLAVAVGLLGAIAFATLLSRRDRLLWAVSFGLVVGGTTTIKPFAILYFLLLIPIVPRIPRARRARMLLSALVGLLIPLFAVFVSLFRLNLIHPFLFVFFILDPLHAHLGFPGIWFLAKWCLSPPLLLLSFFGLLAICTTSETKDSVERRLLLLGVAAGMIGYFAQMKGYPYHRYPLVACLLLLLSIELTSAMKRVGAARWIGITGLLFGAVLASIYLRHALHTSWSNDMGSALKDDLNSLGGDRLSGKIQCIDSIYGCTRVLYDMRLVQSTGMMYDEFLFMANPPSEIIAHRDNFLRSLEKEEPRVIVITPNLFPTGPMAYKKLLIWPAFNAFLSRCYDETTERVFPHGSPTEPGYRLYSAATKCRE
jgi:hypothetical protein